jgi:hypothetical protein
MSTLPPLPAPGEDPLVIPDQLTGPAVAELNRQGLRLDPDRWTKIPHKDAYQRHPNPRLDR